MTDYEDTVGKIFEAAPTDEAATKFTKTFGTVGFAVATGGASLDEQKLYDDNKVQAEKTRQLCLLGAWQQFAKNAMGEFVGE